jgi:hypothetical protein
MIALRGARFACAQMQECTYPAMQYSCSIHVARTQQPSMTTLCSLVKKDTPSQYSLMLGVPSTAAVLGAQNPVPILATLYRLVLGDLRTSSKAVLGLSYTPQHRPVLGILAG